MESIHKDSYHMDKVAFCAQEQWASSSENYPNLGHVFQEGHQGAWTCHRDNNKKKMTPKKVNLILKL